MGLVIAVRGIALWNEVSTGVFIQNWVTPSSEIPRRSYMWTWGVGGNPNLEPEQWHFQIFFLANDTAEVSLLWNLNETVLFRRTAAEIGEAVDVPLPRTTALWRWDWLIHNPHETGLRVLNFSVSHYPFSFPERQNGFVAMILGVSMILAAGALIYFGRAGIQPKWQH